MDTQSPLASVGQGEARAPWREGCPTGKQAKVNWKKWKANPIQRYGRYSFKGIAPKKGAKWHVLLRVVVKRQDQHQPKVSRILYIDENPATRCG